MTPEGDGKWGEAEWVLKTVTDHGCLSLSLPGARPKLRHGDWKDTNHRFLEGAESEPVELVPSGRTQKAALRWWPWAELIHTAASSKSQAQAQRPSSVCSAAHVFPKTFNCGDNTNVSFRSLGCASYSIFQNQAVCC